SGEWWKMIIIGAVFGIVNSLIRPIVKFFTFPFIILTLGLFTFIINALMLLLTESLSESFSLGLQIHGFWPALWGALIVSIVSTFLSWLTGLKEIKYQKSR
ncbi:MAG: phage holin family protein, partial [Nitrospirota bacterium]